MVLLIGTVFAGVETLGTFKKGESVDLLQAGANFTFCNITSVRYPNNTEAIENVQMTKDVNEYNYTLISDYTKNIGTYIVNGFCSNSSSDLVWAYDFEITGTGYQMTQPKAILSLGFLSILILFLFACAWVNSRIPGGDERDEEGRIMAISRLKYVKSVIYVLMWFIVVAIFFISSNIALAYMGTTLLGDILFSIFNIMLRLSYPMITIWFLWIIVKLFQDKKMKRYLERGLE